MRDRHKRHRTALLPNHNAAADEWAMRNARDIGAIGSAIIASANIASANRVSARLLRAAACLNRRKVRMPGVSDKRRGAKSGHLRLRVSFRYIFERQVLREAATERRNNRHLRAR
jgi:hypothetical protein